MSLITFVVLLKRIEAKKADVSENLWKLDQSKVYDFTNTVKGKFESVDTIEFNSFYNLVKLNSLYKNLDTISFLDIIIEYFDVNNNVICCIRNHKRSVCFF